MKRLILCSVFVLQGFNIMAADQVDSGNDHGGIYPIVIASIMLVSAVIVRLVSLNQNKKSSKARL